MDTQESNSGYIQEGKLKNFKILNAFSRFKEQIHCFGCQPFYRNPISSSSILDIVAHWEQPDSALLDTTILHRIPQRWVSETAEEDNDIDLQYTQLCDTNQFRFWSKVKTKQHQPNWIPMTIFKVKKKETITILALSSNLRWLR